MSGARPPDPAPTAPAAPGPCVLEPRVLGPAVLPILCMLAASVVYATRPVAVARLRAALAPWAERLPPGAVFVPAGPGDAGATGGAAR